jgi:hypothetical protein
MRKAKGPSTATMWRFVDGPMIGMAGAGKIVATLAELIVLEVAGRSPGGRETVSTPLRTMSRPLAANGNHAIYFENSAPLHWYSGE